MRLNRGQQAVLALGMLGLFFMLLWVPYSATYHWPKDKTWVTAEAGYQLIFTPPDSNVCRAAIEDYGGGRLNSFNPAQCEIRLDLRRLGLTLVAAVMGIGALMIIMGLLGRGDDSPLLRRPEPTLADLSPPIGRATPLSPVARNLLERSPALPISYGDLTEASPLVITAKVDYVPVEYQILAIIHDGLLNTDYEFTLQELIERNGRNLDALTFKYRNRGAQQLGNERTYYFDITEGVSALRRRLERRWWQFWK